MTIMEMLEYYYEREMNIVWRFSSNWLMNSLREGFEEKWTEANTRADLLLALMAYLEGGEDVNT